MHPTPNVEQMQNFTIRLPHSSRTRLKQFAIAAGKDSSSYARELLDDALSNQRKQDAQEAHKAIAKITGTHKGKITDASTTINQTLYGEKGAWASQDE